jgi:hypothetical protein
MRFDRFILPGGIWRVTLGGHRLTRVNKPTIPSARIRDYLLAVTAVILFCSWVVGLLNGLAELIGQHRATSLAIAIGSSIGYLWSIQFIMQRSQYVTYLWLRHVEGREFSRS